MLSASPFLTQLLCYVIILQMFSLCWHECMTILKYVGSGLLKLFKN